MSVLGVLGVLWLLSGLEPLITSALDSKPP
jgi:hypothetical protein